MNRLNIEKAIHIELESIFSSQDIPYGKGYFIGSGDEPVFIVYLPYADDVTGRAEDKVAQITYRLKIDIIARNGASYTDAEFKIRTLFEDNGFTYRNGEGSVDEDEPYNYHRTLYYNKNFYFNELEKTNDKESK